MSFIIEYYLKIMNLMGNGKTSDNYFLNYRIDLVGFFLKCSVFTIIGSQKSNYFPKYQIMDNQ